MKGHIQTLSISDIPYADRETGEEFDADRFDDPVMPTLNLARAA